MFIEPIELLYGHHPDTATTGKGCIMNVVSYLNGDEDITDTPDCVCPLVSETAVWVNDIAPNDYSRQRLLPLVLRAMGSRTENVVIIVARAQILTKFARALVGRNRNLRDRFDSTLFEMECYVRDAKHHPHYALRITSMVKAIAERAAVYSPQHELFERGVNLLDHMLRLTDEPEVTPVIEQRAKRLVELATA